MTGCVDVGGAERYCADNVTDDPRKAAGIKYRTAARVLALTVA